MRLYHGTCKERAEEDVYNFKRKAFKISLYDLSDPNFKIELKKRKYSKLPGSLGYGYYTFEENKNLALEFSKKKYKNENQIIKIELNSDLEILDLTDEETQKIFIEFARNKEISKLAKVKYELMANMRNKTSGRISLKQDSFAGIITELFIKYYAQHTSRNIQIVRKSTETFYSPFDSIKYRLGIPNGIEVCIRDEKCIKSIEFEA